MPATPTEAPTLRIGARVLLLDQHDHVLLIHAKDPNEPDHHWWELPGGGADPDEPLPATARRELAEETGIHGVMEQIAAGLGDEYANTGAIPGAIARNKKGDGVSTINGGSARIVLEITNSKRSNWNDYLDEAERNRSSAASLGLVREPGQNIQLLRVSALTASNRADRGGIHTAEEKIAEALGMLGKIDEIKKAMSGPPWPACWARPR